MKKSLDLNTFGDSPAEITLVKILNDLGDESIARVVSRFLGQSSEHLKILSRQVTDKKTRIWLAWLLRGWYFKRIDEWEKIKNEHITTYIKNCISKKIAIFRKGEYT